MTGLATVVVSAVGAVVGGFLACLGVAGFEAGKPERVAGPVRTWRSVRGQLVGVAVFVVGVVVLWASLSVAGVVA